MPTYIIRHSPEREEYLLWSTVVDAPTSWVMTRQEALDYAADGLMTDPVKAQHALNRLRRTDEQGSSEHSDPLYGYDMKSFRWMEQAPEDVGRPHEVPGAPGMFAGRDVTRDELFDASQKPPKDPS